ncbi:MAG: hypothetical protein R3E42_06880 [Burkholderiaceae bacterium]
MPASSSPAQAVRWIQDVLIRNLKMPPAPACAMKAALWRSYWASPVWAKDHHRAGWPRSASGITGEGSVGLIAGQLPRLRLRATARLWPNDRPVVAHLAHDRARSRTCSTLSGKRMVIDRYRRPWPAHDQRIQDMFDVSTLQDQKEATLVVNAGLATRWTMSSPLSGPANCMAWVLSKVDEAVETGPALDALIRHQVVLQRAWPTASAFPNWQAPDAHALVRMSMASGGAESPYDPLASGWNIIHRPQARRHQPGGAHV